MPSQCCTKEPKNIDIEKRNKAIKIAAKAIDEVAELGFAIHTAYSIKHFFLEPYDRH